MRRRTPVLLAVVVAGLLAGCGTSADHAERMALAGLNVAAPKPAQKPSSPPSPPCGDVTASLRPTATQPAPGAMPRGSFMAAIQRRGYLIAGVDQNTQLFAYFNPLDGQLEGFEIDLVHRLAQAIFGDPSKVRFKAITTAERIPAVQDGTVDVVVDAMTITCKRRKEVAFSTVYYDAGQKILVPANSRAGSVTDLAGRPVCATVDSTSLETLEKQRPEPRPYTVAQRTDCLVAMQQGLVAGITSDDSILLGFRAQDPNTRIVGARLADEPYGMAISLAHPDFVRFVNGVLAGMRRDGSWRALYAHWLGRYSTSIPAPPPAHYDG